MDNRNFGTIPFIPGVPSSKEEPLSQYFPPIEEQIVSAYLQKNISPGSWVLDPFCASPRIALEAAREGYRVLVTANNPISRFVLEMLAQPPGQDEFTATLAELASSFIGDERVEPHIKNLYNTSCARCGQIVSADSFIWEHGNPSPYMRSYSCPNCGDSGEHPCTPADVELSSRFTGSGLHKARALERVVASTDQDRIHVEQALTVYIPRALYALITIINKIEGLNLSSTGQKCLAALLLHAFDQANALWRFPSQKERRKQLVIPRHFRENNVWLALENGISLWSAHEGEPNIKVPITNWPEQPPITGGICIHEGRFTTFAESVRDLPIKCVCTAIPRPNQAFWTLSALWAGWIWGREAVGGYKGVLRRQRYDWAWHTNALSSVFKQLSNNLPLTTTIFGLIGEAEPGFIGAAMVAAGVAGYHLDSIAIRPDKDQAQIHWSSANSHELFDVNQAFAVTAIQSSKSYLMVKGEPANYLTTMAAAFLRIGQKWRPLSSDHKDHIKEVTELAKMNLDKTQDQPSPSAVYTSMYKAVREALSYRSGFLQFNLQDLPSIEAASKNLNIQSPLFSLDFSSPSEAPDDGFEDAFSALTDSELVPEKERPTRSSDISQSSFLWLRESDEAMRVSLTDSYEVSLVNYLITHPGCTLHEIDKMMCSIFPGLFTPDLEFISLCLESYAVLDPDNAGRWMIRQEDSLMERQVDLENICHLVHQIGEHLGFSSKDRKDSTSKTYILWQDIKTNLEYWFFPTISATISEIVLYGEHPTAKSFIAIPGSRANLVIYKLRHDPRLSKAFNPTLGNWRFVKFRHLRTLVESEMLNRDNLDQMLALDPITYSTPQLWLI
jgi:hypothetical protein